MSSQAQPLPQSISNTQTGIVRTNVQKRGLVTGSKKGVQEPPNLAKCPTVKERLSKTVPSNRDSKSLFNKQTTVTLKPSKVTSSFTKTHNDLKKPLNKCLLEKTDRSGNTQTVYQETQILGKLVNKQGLSHTQKSVAVTSKQGSSLISTEKATKSTSVTVAGVKKAAPHQQCHTTFKLPSKPTVQAPVPQTVPRPTKASGVSSGLKVQPKTPKSTYNPGTNGVRTVPLDDRNKPTTAQEERM